MIDFILTLFSAKRDTNSGTATNLINVRAFGIFDLLFKH